MMDPELAIIVLRLLQYAGASAVFGGAAFYFYAFPHDDVFPVGRLAWARPLLTIGGLVIAIGAGLGFLAQTAVMAGSWPEALTRAALGYVATEMPLGRAAVLRGVLALLLLAALFLLPHKSGQWLAALLLGGLIAASLGWAGHGAQGGWLHLSANIVHILAACIWIGALLCFLLLLAAPGTHTPEVQAILHQALSRFSGVGAALVAALVATGLVNSWFLVGPEGVIRLTASPYGLLLLLKLALFASMLALAALNRFRLSPALGRALAGDGSQAASLAWLKRSVALEAVAGLAVLAIVAWLGMLAPVAAG